MQNENCQAARCKKRTR
uniref:Uncharacterized protein n=1 Tax=Arundo donax TaxID=35708 RepID=A0A0A9G9J7_ARUDO